jgi:hypothetical protein
MKQRFNPRILVTLFFLGAGAYAVFAARDWPDNVRLFPWLAGFGLVAMSLIQLVIDIREPAGKVTKVMDFEFAEGVDPQVARRRVANIAGWIVGFAIAIWLIGFHIAIPLMLFGYLRFQGKETLILSISLTALTWVLFWGVFEKLLHLPFPQGQFYLWFT